jgi:uncharacterized surface protein with fasciclin (FAS1) repeats
VKISIEDGKLKINDANVLKNDIMASNGIIHVIDTVLMPPSGKSHTVTSQAKVKKCPKS